MREHGAQSVTLCAGRPLTVGAVTIMTIDRTESHADDVGAGAWLSAVKEPYALVVRDAAGVRALGIGGQAVSLGQLRESVPGLDALLASI